jgi:CRP-like cAMP-binding protein
MRREHKPSTQELIEFFRSVPLFTGVGSAVLGDFAQACRFLQIRKDEVLFTQNEPAHTMYLVHKGYISLFLATADGRELVINEMHPGDCFGELALFTDQPRSTGAMGGADSEVIALPRDVFLRGVQSDPALIRNVLQTTARRLQVSGERESALAFLSSEARIVRVLLLLDQRAGRTGLVRTTQENLAQYVGLTRQTVAKALGEWRRAGWVGTRRGAIEIYDRTSLEKLAVDEQI